MNTSTGKPAYDEAPAQAQQQEPGRKDIADAMEAFGELAALKITEKQTIQLDEVKTMQRLGGALVDELAHLRAGLALAVVIFELLADFPYTGAPDIAMRCIARETLAKLKERRPC